VRDWFAGVRETMREVWGVNDKFMFTKDVTLKALIRVLGEVMKQKKPMDAWSSQGADAFSRS